MKDEDLDRILRTAKGDFPLASGFQRDVWSRIENARPTPTSWLAFWDLLTRPLVTASGMAAMIALGLLLGAATAPEPEDAQISYFESISPFIHLANR